MVVKTYRNDGINHKDGLGTRPTTIAAGARWNLTVAQDENLRRAVRTEETVGIQIKNSSKANISVKIDGSDLSAIYIPKKASESMVVEFVQDIMIVNEDDAVTIATNELVVTVTTGANTVSGAAGLGDIIVTSDFEGAFWIQSYTAADDLTHALNGGVSKKLADVVIKCLAHPCLIGTTGAETFPLAVGDILGITKIDIGTLFVINTAAGNDTNLEIIGVTV